MRLLADLVLWGVQEGELMKRRHEEDETANVHKLQEEKVHHAPHGKKKDHHTAE